MRKHPNKLVRDRIPELIRADGRDCEVVCLAVDEFRAALLDKLMEECVEVRSASDNQIIAELADLLEVVDAILWERGTAMAVVENEKSRRRAERGGFLQRLKLLWMDDVQVLRDVKRREGA